MKNIDEALQQLYSLNEDKSKRLNRQNWLVYFNGTFFLEACKQSDFLDAVLVFLKNHNLEDFGIH